MPTSAPSDIGCVLHTVYSDGVDCKNALARTILTMVKNVDTSKEIVITSDDEVLVVVGKEPVAIQNSFLRTPHKRWQLIISTPHKLHFKWQKATKYNLVFQNHAMKHALNDELEQQKSCYHKCIVYKLTVCCKKSSYHVIIMQSGEYSHC